jgi:hypothetical protein
LKNQLQRAEIELFFTLLEGTQVEVFDERGIVRLRGAVETTAPDLGILWIRSDKGERKLLDIKVHRIRPITGPWNPGR